MQGRHPQHLILTGLQGTEIGTYRSETRWRANRETMRLSYARHGNPEPSPKAVLTGFFHFARLVTQPPPVLGVTGGSDPHKVHRSHGCQRANLHRSTGKGGWKPPPHRQPPIHGEQPAFCHWQATGQAAKVRPFPFGKLRIRNDNGRQGCRPHISLRGRRRSKKRQAGSPHHLVRRCG